MFDKPASTHVPLLPALALRWSGRAYDADRPVPREALGALLEAARWAPSCYGAQPWRILVWDRFAQPAHWERAFRCLAAGNQGWAAAAPVLLLVAADSRFAHDDSPNRWAAYDTGAAAMSLCVQATALQLMVHQMGGFDADALRAAFRIPERFEPMAMATVGYQLAQARIPEAQREREQAPRARRPLGESFFEGEWGQAFA